MKENGSLLTPKKLYEKAYNVFKQESRDYSQSRRDGEEKQSTFEEPLDAAAYIDSKYTDYVNGQNNVTEEDVLKDIETFENKGLTKDEVFEDFPANTRKALEDFKNGKI